MRQLVPSFTDVLYKMILMFEYLHHMKVSYFMNDCHQGRRQYTKSSSLSYQYFEFQLWLCPQIAVASWANLLTILLLVLFCFAFICLFCVLPLVHREGRHWIGDHSGHFSLAFCDTVTYLLQQVNSCRMGKICSLKVTGTERVKYTVSSWMRQRQHFIGKWSDMFA